MFETQKFKSYQPAEPEVVNLKEKPVSGGMLKAEKDKEKKRNIKF